MMQRLLQFTRDLFEADPTERPASTPTSGTAHGFKPIVAKTQDTRAHDAIEFIATPGIDSRLAPAQAGFIHPKASRQAVLGGVPVAYAFRRSARRSIGFSVSAMGLAVSAPKWVALRAIDAAVQEKADWILRKLRETQERAQRADADRVEWRAGAVIPYLGGSLQLRLDPSLSAVRFHAPVPETPETPEVLATLTLPLAQHAAPEVLQRAAQQWLMRQARPLFTERLNHFAPQLQVQWRKLSLSSARTRWGSASASGSIRLNWRLMHFKPAVIDYVVVHELSHLRVMDHSPRFWATVASVMPDYQILRAELKDESIPRD